MRHLYEGALTPFKVLRLAQGDPKQEPRKNSDDYVRPFNVPKSYQIASSAFPSRVTFWPPLFGVPISRFSCAGCRVSFCWAAC